MKDMVEIIGKSSITRRLAVVRDALADEFRILCDVQDFQAKLRELQNAAQSRRPSVLAKLYALFDSCGIPYEKDKSVKYYAQLIQNADIPTYENIEKRILGRLSDIYSEYPDPSEYLSRIVRRCSSPDDHWQDDTLRLQILKQFVKYGNCLKDAGFGGKTTDRNGKEKGSNKALRDYVKGKLNKKSVSDDDLLENLDDGIFDCLANAADAEKKSNGKYGLIKMADDLAGGKFREGGATKKSLYLFAIVYDMSYYCGDDEGIINYQTDIEKNLFGDYYQNNLIRFLTDAYRENRVSDFQRLPSGQGINYKNPYEMIYLWALTREGCTPQEKICLAAEMIKSVSDKKSTQGNSVPTALHTEQFRKLFSEDILKLPADEFEKFILKWYNGDLSAAYTDKEGNLKLGKVAEMTLNTDQNSAFYEYQLILEKIKGEGLLLEDCSYGLWFIDLPAADQLDMDLSEDFLLLLKSTDSFLGKLSGTRNKLLFETNPKNITRTHIIVAYYYYYNARHEKNSAGKSFGEVFDSFKQEADVILETCGYKLFSGKDIFDLLVAFSSYARMNL